MQSLVITLEDTNKKPKQINKEIEVNKSKSEIDMLDLRPLVNSPTFPQRILDRVFQS